MTSHTKLMEVFLIVIWVCFIVNFSFGDVIISKCNEDCSIQLKDVPDKDLFCNKECKLIQCHSGCKSYYRAVNSSCQTVCSESYKKDGTSLQQTENIRVFHGVRDHHKIMYFLVSVSYNGNQFIVITWQQDKRQFCTQGCSYGLFLYTNNIKSLLGVLDAPELKKDSKGYSSLTLHWNAPISSNVTYFIQSRELDTNGDWLTYSSLQPNGDIQITGLQPYITYKFRVSVVISTNDVSYTQESENITTLPHGVPASPPTITEISAPTSSVISLSWKQPTYTNGPLLCYKLRLEPLNNKELHETNIEVPANVTSWTFRQLTSSQEYLVSISAWNQAGEGQFDTTNMTTPGSGNLSKEDIPYLILAEDNQVILQDMTDVIIKGPDTLHITQTQIKGIAAHVRKQLILCSDSTGKVSQINMEDKVVTEDIYPSLGHPGAMTIDWLHNYTYIVDGFMIKRCDLDRPTCIMATVMLPSQPTVIQVDPINGYLFFNQGSTNMGLYAIDIGEITPSGPANHFLLVRFEVNAFSIDLNNMQIYFPNNSMNTIMSSFLDGSSVSNVRKSGNVVRPNYYQISSLVYSNGVFFFTNGSKVLFEEYNTVKEAFYLNEMLLFGTHYSSLNVYQQMTQPHPVPHSPPQNVRALFSDQRVYIQWRRPKTLVYQGKGAWHTWFYEICLYQDDGTENEIFEKVSGSFLEVENLVPNTTYEIKVRAWSLMGSGPWSDVFVGRTLTLDATTAKVIVAATQSESRGIVYEIDMNGRHVNNLTTLSFWERQLIDLTWSDNMIFWVSNFNKVFVYDRTIGQQREILHISDATSVAYDWLGQKLYWSNPVQNVIRRSDLGGHNEEYVIPGKARHMAIDAIQGRIYWVTMNTMEAAFLNGEDHIIYFSLPYFCGKHVISLTLNFDLRKVLWYVKSFERQELFMSDLLGNGITADQLAVQPLGSFISIAHFSVMQYFSHRLFWQNEQGSIVVGDIECNYTSEITVDPVSVFTVTHESLHPYPEGLDKSTLKIIPSEIQQSSIKCEGYWSSFNLTWQKAYTNHGKIFYEVSIQIKNDKNLAGHTTNNWMELRDIAAYTEITVTIRAYSYWGYGPVTVSKIHSPMSVPSQPLTPRVYITQHKESMTSENSLAADFRWTLPEHQNGIITHFIVYSWKSGDDDKKNTTSLPETARHFNLQCLKPSMTYFFQVSACTVIGCGPISELVSAEADAVNPVPKLLIVTSDHLMIEETDSAGNRTMILEPSISPITATYLAQDDRIFWINKNNVLMETNQHVQKKLLDLNGQVSDITIDWISRTLYIVETDTMESSSKIISYLLDQSTSVELLWRNSLIDSIVSDPLTSTIIWTEKKKGGATYSLYKLERDGKVTSMFSTVRGKRETTTCNCTSDFTPGRRLAVDHSQDKKMEIVFYDAVSNSVMASDLDGCYCRPLTSDLTNKGLPPDSLSVDHSHVYWYNKTEKLLYSLNKQSGGLTNRIMDDVKDIIAYGTHLQPLPSTECLDPNAYQGPVKVVHKTNQTITLELQPVAWPLSCDGISRPDTKYTLYYKSGTGTDSCGPSDAGCLIEFSYNNIVTLTSLQPYTSYIIHGAISNYYTEYLSEALSKPVIVTTLTGVPSKAVIKRVSGNTPEQVDISWSQPAIPNGPVTDLVYNIQYSTLTNDGLLKATKVYNSTSNKTPNQMSISELLPNHTYQFQVKTSNGKQKFFSISDPVTFRTFPTPNDIVLLSANQHSLSVTWKSPSDIIVFYKFQYQKCPYDSEMLGETVPSITIKNTTYNATFHDLQPFTDYCLRMVILYGKSYIWKGKSGFIFRTSSSVPDLPLPPRVETLSREVGYEVVWLEPKDNGEAINNYILQYWNDESQIWYDIFNGTETRWIIDNEILPPGKEYMFRVAAGNANGLGPFSFNSTVFTFTEFSKSTEDNIAIISIALSFLFVFLLVLLMAVCYVIRRKNRKKRKPKQFIAVGRGVDTELAILRDLPHTTQQQNNSLYSINLIPTNGDIANLPHFRRDQLMLTKFLGSGAFGEVFEGIAKNIISDSSGETKVAVKTLRKSASDHEKEEFLKEAVLMSHFKHDHILSLLGVCLDNDPQFIILELMEGGDLLSFLRTSRGLTPNASCLCLTDLVKICVHVARGCKYLEEMHFVHRDLAARNCLVSSKCPAEIAVKIGDFGLARDIYKNDYYRKEGEGLLPVRWMSPESLVDGVFTTQSDIWAFGVLMWEVMTFGQQPYQARTNIEVLHFVRACGQLDKPEHCPEELYLLMNGCWSYNTEDRITFSYILQQLEQFHEKCVTLLADYIMPVRTRPPAEAAGYQDNNSLHNNNNNNNKTNKRMTSSRGHDMSNHQAYNKIHRATSFDSPEPCDASSDYLHPQTNGTPTYLEILHDPVAQSSVPSGRKMSDSSSHGSVHEPVVRKQSQSSMQSARKMSESSSHGSVHEPVVRKSSQSSMQSARKLSECSSHCSLYEPVVRKTSRHNSTSSDIYGQVQFTGYSIISVPEEVLPQACAIGPDKLPAGLRIPDKITSQSVLRVPDEITSQSGHRVPDEITSQSGHRVPDEITSQSGHRVPDEITLQSGLGVPDEFTSQSGLHAPEKIPACSDDEEMQHNILSCQQNYEDILMNYDHVPPTNYVVKSCDQDDPSANNRKQSPVNHKHDSSHVNSVSNHINHNQNSCHNNQNHDLCFSPRLVPMNAESVALSQHNIHHNMSEPTFQMGHVRQYCHSVDKNNDFLLNYDHVPPQDPHLNYDYPSRLCIEEKFEKTNKHPHARNVNGKICYNSAENILSQEHKMYKNLEFTDNMNYVDCNRNRGSHSSLSPHSSPHIVYGGNLQYWTTNGIPGNSVVIRGPKSQIYPVSGKETLAATLV